MVVTHGDWALAKSQRDSAARQAAEFLLNYETCLAVGDTLAAAKKLEAARTYANKYKSLNERMIQIDSMIEEKES